MVTGVFDIPFERDFIFKLDKSDASATKICDYRNGNTHLFIDMGALSVGLNEIRITVSGVRRSPDKHVLAFGLLGAMPYADHAYLRSLAVDSGVRVRMSVPDSAYVVQPSGETVRPKDGVLEFEMNGELLNEAPIIFGITPEQLAACEVQTEITRPTKCVTLWK